MRKIIIGTFVSFLCLQFIPATLFINNHGVVNAQGDWKQEYAEVCAKTQNAMTLSVDELKNLIDRCDTLQGRIEELNGPQGSEKKVYSKRLKMCRDLYSFALEFKNKKE